MKGARQIWETLGMGVVLLLLVIVCALRVPNFWSTVNGAAVLLSVSIIGTVACTMLFCLAAGDFDLSVGATAALAGVIVAQLVGTSGIMVAVAAALAVGALIGFVNGFVIAKVKINALITTLATMQIVRGIAYLKAGGTSIANSDPTLLSLAKWRLGQFSAEVWYMIAAFGLFGFLLNRTVFGRNVLAVGGNQEAARLAGISVEKTKISIFMLQGIVAAFVGIVLASRTFMGDPKAQQDLPLQVISGCVLGGVSLSGGVGTISGVIIGVMIMGVMANAMSLLNVDTYWQMIASGGVLLAAVMIDRLKARSKA